MQTTLCETPEVGVIKCDLSMFIPVLSRIKKTSRMACAKTYGCPAQATVLTWHGVTLRFGDMWQTPKAVVTSQGLKSQGLQLCDYIADVA